MFRLIENLEVLSIICWQPVNNYEDTCMYTYSIIDKNYNEISKSDSYCYLQICINFHKVTNPYPFKDNEYTFEINELLLSDDKRNRSAPWTPSLEM